MSEDEFKTTLILLGFKEVEVFNSHFYSAELVNESAKLKVEITKNTYNIVRLYQIKSSTTFKLIDACKDKEDLLSVVIDELEKQI